MPEEEEKKERTRTPLLDLTQTVSTNIIHLIGNTARRAIKDLKEGYEKILED